MNWDKIGQKKPIHEKDSITFTGRHRRHSNIMVTVTAKEEIRVQSLVKCMDLLKLDLFI